MSLYAAEDGVDYKVVELDEDHVTGTAFNMIFMVWRRRTLEPAYRHAIQVIKELARSHPEGVGVLQVVEVDAVPPSPEAREAFRELLNLDGISHYSVMHDGTGFKAAAVRAIVLGSQTLARPNFAHALHSSVAEAAEWHASMQRSIGRHESAVKIQRIVQDLRNLHRERFPA